MSDMVEQTSQYDFMALRLTPDVCKRIMTQLRKSGDLPDLAGVTIFVVSMSDPSIPPTKLSEIKAFWLHWYFPACGANASSMRWAASLVNF